MNNILFLDIDGVLNSFKYDSDGDIILMEYKIGDTIFNERPFSTTSIAVLNKLIKALNYDVVISSDWRLHFNFTDLVNFLNDELGIQAKIVGKTDEKRGMYDIVYQRAFEINEYIKTNNISNYIVIDDLCLIHYFDLTYKNTIITNPKTGLIESDIKSFINLT